MFKYYSCFKAKGSTILCLTQIERIQSLISIKVYRDFKM